MDGGVNVIHCAEQRVPVRDVQVSDVVTGQEVTGCMSSRDDGPDRVPHFVGTAKV
jgi:hypothetical protein